MKKAPKKNPPRKQVPATIKNKTTTFDACIEYAAVWELPQASERILTKRELKRLSSDALALMKQEMYARHGYVFKDRRTRRYFMNQAWYKELPKTKNMRKVTRSLSEIERKNLRRIVGLERSRR